jgi:hypothetical protein
MAFYLENPNRLTLANAGAAVVDADGVELTGATVELTGYRADRATELTGITWPLTMAEDGSTAIYQVVVDGGDLTNVTPGERAWFRAVLTHSGLSGLAPTFWLHEVLLLRA